MSPSRPSAASGATDLTHKHGIDDDGQVYWYQDAVIYQLHVKVYRDSSGDGRGDFRGLMSKLDYLQDLGVTAIWLLPFYPSPLKDDGYDTADYRKIHPFYGDIKDFKAFLKAAKRRGLRVITELVLNHTSDQHEWFQKARRAKPGSPARDFYVWSDSPERYKDARIIFRDFESSNWSWDSVAQAYYWHRFYSHQPDLNWENPAVVEALYKIVDYWMDMGIDGLRLDAVPYLFESEGTNCENLPATHQALKDLRAHVEGKYGPDRMLLAEANMWPDEVVDYFGDGDECHMAFHFPLMPRMFMATRMEDRFPIIDILQQTPEIPENAQWATFLRNHDELTLEMVTDEERDYMWRYFAEDSRARINLGIRRRLAPLLGNNRRLIELMNGMLFSLPGTPVVYYGDEIGMGDNIYLGDRDGVRTPMQWSADRNAGFSDANPQKLYLPIVIDPEYHASSVNVEAQWANPESLLWWMKRLIAMRKAHPALAHGRLEWVPSENRKVLTFIRQIRANGEAGALSGDDETILCVVNLSRHAQYVELDLGQYEGMRPVALLGHTEFPPIGELPYMLTLGPHDFYWFVLEEARAEHDSRRYEVPTLTLAGGWHSLVTGNTKQLEGLLPVYLRERRWFRSKGRRLRGVSIADVIPLKGTTRGDVPGFVVLVACEFAEGHPETYVLVLAALQVDVRPGYESPIPPTTLAKVRVIGDGDDAAEYAVFDGLADHAVNTALLATVLGKKGLAGTAGSIEPKATSALRRVRRSGTGVEPSPLGVDQSNSAVVYGDRYLLKVFRMLEEGESPDVEVGRFLTEQARFEHAPAVAASLDYCPDVRKLPKGGGPTAADPRTLAILQEYVPNEGSAWEYTLDSVQRFLEQALANPDAQPADVTAGADTDLLDLAQAELPEFAQETIEHYLESARLLGQRTAEMHRALASADDGDSFAREPLTAMYRRSLYQSLRASTKRTLASVKKLAVDQPRLQEMLDLEDAILARITGLLDVELTDVRIRTHGDYHLGQVLWTGRDFRIIDFEGEPGRTIGERRIKRTALKDVAGMIRSFHYASAMAVRAVAESIGSDADDERLDAWGAFWYRWVTATFVRSYLEEAEGAGFLPERAQDLAMTLDAMLLEKAIYELAYEANNRPEWLWLPARGIADLLAGDSLAAG